jgi:hypothetical protein
MNSSHKFKTQGTPDAQRTGADAHAVLASEGGISFQPPVSASSDVDPFTEWLGLMDVVQMLCPVWPVRDKPMQGTQWLL